MNKEKLNSHNSEQDKKNIKTSGNPSDSRYKSSGNQIESGNQKHDNSFLNRFKGIKTTRWIRFGFVSAVFFLWVLWMANPWLALLWFLLLDIYITGFIPWAWWKNTTGPTRIIMGWVDAIVYALVLVYFIFIFIGQNYKIPSSSLEKTLLVGDFLWVNKFVYGPRVPQTPLHFPLAQHTLPLTESTPSYIEKPQLKYHRLAGLRKIERGDIVVFNYPQGDTVATRIPNPDYYQICYDLRAKGIENPTEYIKNNPGRFGKLVWRPVDRRENYVKRAIGLPGERLAIKNDIVYINGKALPEPQNVQFNYIIPVSETIDTEQWQQIGVRAEDHGDIPQSAEYTGYKFYNVPLTYEMKATVEKWPQVSGPLRRESESGLYDLSGVFPLGALYKWTRNNMGEIWIPKKGATLHLTPANYPVYERAIRTYEGNELHRIGDKFYINGKLTDRYTFKYDYYWMMGDNRDRSLDSRYWGFVPEDHIVGTPWRVLVSLDEEKGLFSGKIRPRILANPNPDKSAGVWAK